MQVPNSDTFYIIGMSPGNSYFKDEEIKYLLEKTVSRYGRVAIMIADVPAIATYVAFGYAENKARRLKAIPQGNLLKNKVTRGMGDLGYSSDQVRIIEWADEVENNTDYQKSLTAIKSLYNTNLKFQHDADETTRTVLVGSKRELVDIEKSVKTAVHYLLSEFAFLVWAPKLLHVQKVVYIYHKNWLVYENFIAGIYDSIPKSGMEFLLMENPYETYNPLWALEETDIDSSYVNSLDRVTKTKTLRVAFSNYPPALIQDKNGNISGIFYEIIMRIAKKYGWNVVWSEETGYGVIIEGLESNRFDIFGSTVWPTPERLESASFSESLYTSEVFEWVRPDFILDKNDLNTRVVVKEGDISHSITLTDYPNNRLVYVPQLTDPRELLTFVATNRGDVTFAEPSLVNLFNETSEIKLIRASDTPIRTYGNTFIFKKDDVSLRDVFNQELEMFTKLILEK